MSEIPISPVYGVMGRLVPSAPAPVKATTSNEIIRLDHATHTWSKVGIMNTARYLHRVIHDGTVFLVVG